MKRNVAKALALALALCLGVFGLSGCFCSKQETTQEEPTSNVSDSKPEVVVPTEPFYVLVVGDDSRTGTIEAEKENQSDTVMLVRVDPTTYHITIVSIPRDTTTNINGTDTKFDQAYQYYGIEGTVQAAEDLTGVKISYYLDMGFVGFVDFVNDIDGVDVTVPMTISLTDIITGKKITVEEGDQHLNGNEALVYARVRKAYGDDMEAIRQTQDRQVLQKLITKVSQMPADQASAVVPVFVSALTNTNMDSEVLAKLVENFCDNSGSITFDSTSGPYQGSIVNDIWLIPRDEEAWAELMAVVDAGGDPATVIAPKNVN